MSETNCYSFHPGHHLHYKKVDTFNQPRSLVDVSHVMDTAFLVTVNGVTEYWYHHNPKKLLDALTRSHPEGIETTEDKKFLFVFTGTLIERFNMSQEPLTQCITLTGAKPIDPRVIDIVKKLHATNIKMLIERGISA